MKKISEIVGADAVELLADLMEPAGKIIADEEIQKAFQSKSVNKGKLVKDILKNHKDSAIEILAILNQIPVEEYKPNIVQILSQVIDLVNDEDLLDFFHSQGQQMAAESSGTATETTEETEEK